MPKLTAEQRTFLENAFPGTVTTLREDGSPHNTVGWVDVTEDAVVFNTAEGRAKPEHLRNDPRAAITVIDPKDDHRWISVSGPAELTHEGADETIDKLAKKYLGIDSYPFRSQGERRVNVLVRPEHIDAAGLDG